MSRALAAATDRITITAAASINSLAERTWMAWVKRSALNPSAGTYRLLFTKGLDNFDFQRGVYFSRYAGPTVHSIEGFIQNADESDSTFIENDEADTLVPVGTWAHVAMQLSNAGDKKIKLFVDGNLLTPVFGVSALVAIPNDSAANQTIGAFVGQPAGTESVLASIFDFRIYNSILSGSDLAEIIAVGPTADPAPANLMCQLTFETDQGATEPDASGNANTGAITGATFSADNPTFSTVDAIAPASGHQTATDLRVVVDGTGFIPDAAVLSFSGTGVTVAGYESRSATRIIARVNIAFDAATTARDVTVDSATLAAAFTVQAYILGINTGPIYRTLRNQRVPRRGMV